MCCVRYPGAIHSVFHCGLCFVSSFSASGLPLVPIYASGLLSGAVTSSGFLLRNDFSEGKMENPLQMYVQGIHEELDYYPSWPPNSPHELGAVGILKDGKFQQVTTLANLGIAFKVIKGPVGADLSLTSGEDVSVQIKAQGQTIQGSKLPKAKAAAVVEFKSAGAYLFQAHNPTVSLIDNQVKLSEQILGKFRSRTTSGKRGWEYNWCVITDVITVARVTVLISTSKNSLIELSADGDIPVNGAVPLAAASAKFSVTRNVGKVLSYITGDGTNTPLLRLTRVKQTFLQRIFGGADAGDVVKAAPQAPGGLPRILLEEVPAAELTPVIDKDGNVMRAWNFPKPQPKAQADQPQPVAPKPKAAAPKPAAAAPKPKAAAAKSTAAAAKKKSAARKK